MAEKQSTSQPPQTPQNPPQTEDTPEVGEEEVEKKEQEELPPFEIVEGSRIPASSFKFQFKNVEYSSGRNKTLLCYTVERAGGQVYSGYLEDEHAFSHAEEAFFTTVLPQFLSAGPVTVTCYVSSSPCVSCAASIAKCLKRSKALQLRLVLARIFQWEEPEIRGALRGLRSAGCALRMMRSTDFAHLWKNFVEPDAPADGEEGVVVEGEGGQVGGEFGVFIPWEDLEENSRYYEEKLAEILR